jgi:hypothetical protein
MLGVLLTMTLTAEPATLLVWGGGKTPEDAEKSVADYKAKSEAGKWGTYVKLAAGFPMIVSSDKVPGLNPGFHVVVLGASDEGAGADALNMFKVLEASVYSKPAKEWSLARGCASGVESWKWGPAARAKGKDYTLAGVVFSTGTTDSDSMAVAVRHEPKGGAATVKFFDMNDCAGATELSVRGSSLTADTTCVTGRCTIWGHSEYRTTFSVKDGKVEQTDKETRFINKAECD